MHDIYNIVDIENDFHFLYNVIFMLTQDKGWTVMHNKNGNDFAALSEEDKCPFYVETNICLHCQNMELYDKLLL